MTLFTRVSRLFKADVHGILDVLEEPETILKHAVREMEEEIEKSRLQLKKLDKQLERIDMLKKNLLAKLATTEQQIDYAFSENNELLIKSQLKKKLEIKLKIDSMEHSILQLNDEKSELENECTEQNEKLNSIIEKLNIFADKPVYCDASHVDNIDGSETVSHEDIELAFLQEKKRRAEDLKESNSTGDK